MRPQKVYLTMATILLCLLTLASSIQGQISVSQALGSFGTINYVPTPTPTPVPSPSPNLVLASSFESPVTYSGTSFHGADEGFDWDNFNQYSVLAYGGQMAIDTAEAHSGSRSVHLYSTGMELRSQHNLHMNDGAPVGEEIGYMSEYTFERWTRYPSNFAMNTLYSSEPQYDVNTWNKVTLFELRSEYGGGVDCHPVGLFICEYEGMYFWRLANYFYHGEGPGYYWRHYFDNTNVPVPTFGEWFKLTLYVNRPQGVLKIWINDQIVFDMNPSSVNHLGESFVLWDGVTSRHYLAPIQMYGGEGSFVHSPESWNDDIKLWRGYHVE